MKVVDKVPTTQLLQFYRQMCLIRTFEERAAEEYMRGRVRGFLHLYIGEEAIAVGAMAAIRPQDYVVTHYRDHGHALARGIDPKACMAELFGKATGCSKGKGGSMHLFDVSRNFLGGYAIVGAQLPVAVGLALAAQYLGEERIVLCLFGDGALNQGEFHESLNLASLWKLPVLFFLENNLYGMGSHIDRTYAAGRDVFRAADHYRIPSRQIDGMDVLEVWQVTKTAADWVRGDNGPFFLEAVTYRFRGHSMADPSEYRDKAEEETWKARDPIPTVKRYLLNHHLASEAEVEHLERDAEAEVEAAVRFAQESPEPAPEELSKDVYP